MTHSGVLVFTAMLLSVAAVTSFGVCPTFVITESKNLYAKYTSCGVHFTCNGLDGSNIWTTVYGPKTPMVGAVTSFDIDARVVSGSVETKFTIYETVILRWTNNGKTANWQQWKNNRFNTIASSDILPGSGTHHVTVVMGTKGFSVLEDGNYKGQYLQSKTEVKPTYHMQIWDKGGKVDVLVTSITMKDGLLGGSIPGNSGYLPA